MGNPRRDAFEYGVLIVLSSSMAAVFGFMLAYSSQRNPDGTRRKIPKVNLEDEVDLRQALIELKQSFSQMKRENSTFTKPSPSGTAEKGSATTSNAPPASIGNQATK
ncbi:hypothetical protein ACHAXN_013407 [Cyclotella atomus]